MKHTNNISCTPHLLSLPHERNRNCEEPVKGQARSRDSLRSPLTEPSQFQSNPQLWKQKKKIEYRLYGSLRPNGVNMCPQSQPSEPNRSSGQSAARGPFDAERATWLTAAEAAAYLNFKVRTILLWARQGRVKAYALTGTQRRVWRFLQVDLDAIVIQKKPVVSSAQPSVLVNERRI
jgi:excisionase family DNA binding protein